MRKAVITTIVLLSALLPLFAYSSGVMFLGGPAGPAATPTPAPTSIVNQAPPFTPLSDSAAATLSRAVIVAESVPTNVNDGTGWDANNQIWTTPSYFYTHAGEELWYPNSAFSTVDGNFTGSTGNILRWAAAKYGFDSNWMFAQAQEENQWKNDCASLHGGGKNKCNEGGDCYDPDGSDTTGTAYANWSFLGFTASNSAGNFTGNVGLTKTLCASWGLLQSKVAYAEKYTWPMIAISSAWGADYLGAKWRSCMNGGSEQTSHFGSDYSNAVTQATSNPNGLASSASPAFTGPTNIVFPLSGYSSETILQYLAAGCYGSHFSGGWYDNGALCYINASGTSCGSFATDNLVYNLTHQTWPK